MEPEPEKRGWPETGLKAALALAVGLVLLGWLLNTPPGLLGKADAVGYAVCHRIDLRSFHLGERALPLCARCSGMYLGAMLALAYQAIRRPRRSGMPPRPVQAVLVVFVLAFALDGINSFLSLFSSSIPAYEPQNWLRLVTGSGMGLAIALVLYPAFNQTIWKVQDRRPAIDSLGSFALLLALTGVIILALLSGYPVLLYPLALISAAGVLVLLTLVYTMIWLMVLRRDNTIRQVRQLLWPLVAGFGVALLQVVLLDLARYALTGTWDGFHFG
jgi:uncharacterized membrane protein